RVTNTPCCPFCCHRFSCSSNSNDKLPCNCSSSSTEQKRTRCSCSRRRSVVRTLVRKRGLRDATYSSQDSGSGAAAHGTTTCRWSTFSVVQSDFSQDTVKEFDGTDVSSNASHRRHCDFRKFHANAKTSLSYPGDVMQSR